MLIAEANGKLVKLLSERLYPEKMTLLAKFDLLTGDRRQRAISYIEECQAYEAELRQLSVPTLLALADDESHQEKEMQKERAEQEEYNRFFYDRSSRANYTPWIGREQWSVDEATALLLGKNPEVVNWQTINPLVYKSQFAERYSALRQKITDAVEANKVHSSRTPAAYLYYASSIGFVLPADLQVLLMPSSSEPVEEHEPTDKTPDNEGFSFRQLIEQNRDRLEQRAP
jgi:hypothetical protein